MPKLLIIIPIFLLNINFKKKIAPNADNKTPATDIAKIRVSVALEMIITQIPFAINTMKTIKHSMDLPLLKGISIFLSKPIITQTPIFKTAILKRQNTLPWLLLRALKN
jgi:hypothetical protein